MSNRIDTKKVLQAVTKSRNGTTAAGAAKHFGVPKYAVYKMRRAIDVLGQAEVDSLIFSGKSITGIEKVVKGKNEKAEQGVAEGIKEDIRGLEISEGEHAGENFVILDWEDKFIDGLAEHDEAGLSVSRGNGKTTFVASIAVSAFCGKMSRRRGQVILCAASLKQGNVPFQHIKEFLRPRIDNEKIEGSTKKYKKPRFRVVDNSQEKHIIDEVTGSKLSVIGSDSDLAHGAAPSFVLADEPAKWKSGGR